MMLKTLAKDKPVTIDRGWIFQPLGVFWSNRSGKYLSRLQESPRGILSNHFHFHEKAICMDTRVTHYSSPVAPWAALLLHNT